MTGPTEGRPVDRRARARRPASLLTELGGPRCAAGSRRERTDKGWVVAVPGAGPHPADRRPDDRARRPRRDWMSRTGVTGRCSRRGWTSSPATCSRRPRRDWARRLNDAMAESAAELGGGTAPWRRWPTDDGEQAAAAASGGGTGRGPRSPACCSTPTRRPARRCTTRRSSHSGRRPSGTASRWCCTRRRAAPRARFRRWARMGNVHGRLIDNTIAVTELILHGLLDRHPRLTLVLVHGGGFLPYQAARARRRLPDPGEPSPGELAPRAALGLPAATCTTTRPRCPARRSPS